VNVVGGLKITEPAADLSLAAAIVSSYREAEIDQSMVLIGEVGLSGEVRMVSQLERRIVEAAKLGFTKAVYPKNNKNLLLPAGFQGYGVTTLDEALEKALIPNPNTKRGKPKNPRNGATPSPIPQSIEEDTPKFDEYGNEITGLSELEVSDIDEF
jgi:DNA repair protein RadA/Sms